MPNRYAQMPRPKSPLLHIAPLRIEPILLVILAIVAGSSPASAIGFSLTPVGGTANGAAGQVGDTLVLGVQMHLEEGEYVTIAAPMLIWDREGGNVLDARAAHESSTNVGSYQLNPLADDVWRIWDANDPSGFPAQGRPPTAASQFYTGTNAFSDAQLGATLLEGFEQTSTVLDEDGILLDILTNGVTGAGSYQIGTVEFLLSDLGTTEIGFYTHPSHSVRTFVTGSRAIEFSNDDVTLTPLEVTSGALATLQITVVPEPGTGLLCALGLMHLATCREREAARRSGMTGEETDVG